MEKTMESEPQNMNLCISAATDKSGKQTNQDAYGFSDGCEIIQSMGKDHVSHQKKYDGADEFLAVVSDGVSLADHTESTEDDAAVLLTQKILNDHFDEFSLESSMPLIADEINDTIIHASERLDKKLAAAVTVIGVYPHEIKILSIGDCAAIEFRKGKSSVITPLSVSSVLSDYAGNFDCPGHKMADIYRLKPEPEDIYMLASDGLIKGFTDPDGHVRTEEMLELFKKADCNAEALIHEAKKKSKDNLSVCVIQIEDIQH